MQRGEQLSPEQIQALLKATVEARFAGNSRKQMYGSIEAKLNEHGQKARPEGENLPYHFISIWW